MLKNPFGLRGNQILVISDLAMGERGAKCCCKCPNCGGELIARMGDVKTHHFAHTKEACDETSAFITGLFSLIKGYLADTSQFYAPALAVAYELPYAGIALDHVARYTKIIPDWERSHCENSILISPGKSFSVDSVETALDAKKRAEALILTARKRKMAIRITPPANCKTNAATTYRDLPTLVLDARDIDFHALSSELIRKEIIGNQQRWTWLSNEKINRVFPQIYDEYQKRQEARRIERNRNQEMQVRAPQWPSIDLDHTFGAQIQETIHVDIVSKEQQRALGFEQVKDLFTQQQNIIRDSFGNRWVQCKICGQIKPDIEFPFYGGIDSVNLGECYTCKKQNKC